MIRGMRGRVIVERDVEDLGNHTCSSCQCGQEELAALNNQSTSLIHLASNVCVIAQINTVHERDPEGHASSEYRLIIQ